MCIYIMYIYNVYIYNVYIYNVYVYIYMYIICIYIILSKNTPGVKKGEAKWEAPKVILLLYSTKKIDIMQVEAKACITDRIV